jgi:hypothetical protein
MASLIVETHVAQGGRDQFATAADELRAGLTEMAVHDSHVRHYLVPSDKLGVHVVEADGAEAVVRLAKLLAIEVERIVSAIGNDPEVRG